MCNDSDVVCELRGIRCGECVGKLLSNKRPKIRAPAAAPADDEYRWVWLEGGVNDTGELSQLGGERLGELEHKALVFGATGGGEGLKRTRIAD